MIYKNKKGQVSILLLAILVLILVSASLYLMYSSRKEIAKIQSPLTLIALYERAEIVEDYVEYAFKKSFQESKDASELTKKFKENFNEDLLKSLIGENVDYELSTPDIKVEGQEAKLKIESGNISFTDIQKGIVLLKYNFKIEKEGIKPLGA